MAVQNRPASASSYSQNDRRQGRSKEEEAAASLATPKETGKDAAVGAVLPNLAVIFTLKEQRATTEAILWSTGSTGSQKKI